MTETQSKPKIGVVIPCLNEENYVPKLLYDLTRQNGFDNFEVIVVNSNSTDNTVEVVKQFQDKLPLRVISLDQRGVSRARNAGAEVAKGELLVFLDADVRLPVNFLQVLNREQEKHNADMMSTHIQSDSWHPFDRSFEYWSSRWFEHTFQIGQPLMTGAVHFVKKSLFQKVGGYDETMKRSQDIDFAKRARKFAKNPHFISSLRVRVSNRRHQKDGRIKMMLRSYQWTTGENLGIRTVNHYDFGHYEKGEGQKIRFMNILTNKKLAKAFLKVAWWNVKSAVRKLSGKL